MMKRLLFLALILVSGIAQGQIYQKDPSYGKTFNRTDIDKILQIPDDTVTDGATDKCKLIAKKSGTLYVYNCDSLKWVPLAGATSGNFIRNSTSPQIASYNISGSGLISSTLSIANPGYGLYPLEVGTLPSAGGVSALFSGTVRGADGVSSNEFITVGQLNNTGNFIKNDTTNYQNAGFSISQPGRISYTNDTTGNRYGALELYRTISNPDYKAPQNLRSVLRVYATEAGHEDKELTGMYAGLHIDAQNTQQFTNNTEGIIGSATTVSNFGNGNISLMSGFSAAGGHSSTCTGVIDRWMFFRGTGYNTHSNAGKLNSIVGLGFAKLTPGAVANINILTGIGNIDNATSTQLIGNITWPTGNWNMYDGSGYKSYHSGNLMIIDTTETTFPLWVGGKAKIKDTAYIPKIVAGVLNTDKVLIKNYSSSLSPVSIDSNGVALGTTSGISGTLLNISKVYANHGANITAIRSTPQAFETLTTHAFGLSAGTFQPIITGANNKNWTGSILQGIAVAPTINSGATGTISNAYGETVTRTFNASGATVDTFYYKRTYKSAESTPSTVNNEIFDLVGVSQGIGGRWSRYDATTYPSYWGSGNQLINSNVDNGFGEKLQVSGRVDAQRATRGSNLVTKDQLDSTGSAILATNNFIQNISIAGTAQSASFNITGQGMIAGTNAYKMFMARANRTTGNVLAFKTGTDTSGYVGQGSLLNDDVMLVGLKGNVSIRTRDTARIVFGSHSAEYSYMVGKKAKWLIGDSVQRDPTIPLEVESAQDTSILTSHKIIGNGLVTTGALYTQVSVLSSDVTLTSSYATVVANTSSSARTLTLPTGAAYNGIMYHIKRSSASNSLTLNRSGSETFDDGTTTMTVTNAVIVQLSGSTWYVLAKY